MKNSNKKYKLKINKLYSLQNQNNKTKNKKKRTDKNQIALKLLYHQIHECKISHQLAKQHNKTAQSKTKYKSQETNHNAQNLKKKKKRKNVHTYTHTNTQKKNESIPKCIQQNHMTVLTTVARTLYNCLSWEERGGGVIPSNIHLENTV